MQTSERKVALTLDYSTTVVVVNLARAPWTPNVKSEHEKADRYSKAAHSKILSEAGWPVALHSVPFQAHTRSNIGYAISTTASAVAY